MEAESHASATWYVRMYAYLLVICGAFGVVVGAVVGGTAVADSSLADEVALAALVLGASAVLTGAVTVACGLAARIAARDPHRAGPFRTLALVGIVSGVLCLGLCYATSGSLPTSLIFNLLLAAIAAVIASNLAKSAR